MGESEKCDWDRGCACGVDSGVTAKHVVYHAWTYLHEHECMMSSVHEYIHRVAERDGVSMDKARPIAVEELRDALRADGLETFYDGENFDVEFDQGCSDCATEDGEHDDHSTN